MIFVSSYRHHADWWFFFVHFWHRWSYFIALILLSLCFTSFFHSIQRQQKIFSIRITFRKEKKHFHFFLTYFRNSSIESKDKCHLKIKNRPQYCYRNLNLTHRKNGIRTKKLYFLIKLSPFFTLWCHFECECDWYSLICIKSATKCSFISKNNAFISR